MGIMGVTEKVRVWGYLRTLWGYRNIMSYRYRGYRFIGIM